MAQAECSEKKAERLAELEAKVDGLRLDLAEARGRLALVPGPGQILAWVVGMGVAVAALAFVVARVV